MQNRLTMKLLLLLALAVPALVLAQPCESNVPATIPIGGIACLQLCAFENYTIQLEGDVNGSNGVPVLVMRAGCSATNTDCNVQCTPIEPPAGLVFGGDPFAPDNWYGESECLFIHLYWVHDAVWGLEFFSMCDGCFCLSFDDQLPVELRGSFEAVAGNGEVALHWTTASEASNDRFDIVRDGTVHASVPGLGTSPTGRDYNWVDRDVTNGRDYQYTLVAVDVTGDRRELGTVNATPRGATEALITSYALHQNYPNPFNPSTQIAFDLVDAGHVTIKVYNPMGEAVATLVNTSVSAGRHSVQFDASHLTSGLYFYSITIGDRYSATRKMLLVK